MTQPAGAHGRASAGRLALALASAALAALVPRGHLLAGGDPVADARAAPDPARLVPLFDCYRTNSAWGFALSGKVVDASGTIWTYGRHGQAWLPAVGGAGDVVYLDAADLRAKYAGARTSGSIDAGILQQRAALIAAAAAGNIGHSNTGVRDAGTSTCHAYVRDAAHERYRDVVLGSDGGVADERVTNDADAAQQLLDWLRSIGVARQP